MPHLPENACEACSFIKPYQWVKSVKGGCFCYLVLNITAVVKSPNFTNFF